MKLLNFNSIYSMALTLYDIDITPQEFEDIGLVAWERIGNRHTRLYQYISNTDDKIIELPCNVDIVESVHIPIADAQMTAPDTVFYSIETLFIENYIEAWKRTDSPYYSKGKLVKYHEENNILTFSRNYHNVKVVYHGVIVDEDTGLPMVSDKEVQAIATYIGYTYLYRKAIRMKDKTYFEIAQSLKAEWLKLCNSARIPVHLSQNDMDGILDVKARWDRKQFGKSFKPIL